MLTRIEGDGGERRYIVVSICVRNLNFWPKSKTSEKIKTPRPLTHTAPAGLSTRLGFFCRPEEAPLRAKMLHASSLRPLLGRLRGEYAIEIRKSIEGLEPDEVNEEQLQRELYVYE